MYLPPNQTEEQRGLIKARFNDYLDLIRPLLEEYKAHAHWAKIEIPSPDTRTPTPSDDSWFSFVTGAKGEIPALESGSSTGNLDRLRARLAARYPLKEFNAFRHALDPHNILSNKLIDDLISESDH